MSSWLHAGTLSAGVVLMRTCNVAPCTRFSPDERPSVRHIEDPDLAYVMLRYRQVGLREQPIGRHPPHQLCDRGQVHDFWHVLAGVPTTVLGELALKWFEMVHTKLPGCAVASFFGPLRLTPST